MDTVLVNINPRADSQVVAFYNEALGLQKYAEARIIKTTEDLKPAVIDLSIISKIKKGMEERRKEYIKPLDDHKKAINDVFRTLMMPIETADKLTRDKILVFNTEQEHFHKEQEEINRLRIEAAEKEMLLKGELTESVGLIEVTPQTPHHIATDMGMLGTTKVWKFEVTDFSLLPDQYKLPDMVKIRKVIIAGATIEGVRAWQEDSLRITVK